MTQSLLRLWYKLILKRHNLRETVVPIHLDFMWSLSTLNLECFPPSCSLWSEKEGWNLKGPCRSSGREREWEAEVWHAALFTEFFFYIKPAVCEPQTQEGAEKAREMETGWSSSQLLQSTPSSREQSVTACSITVSLTYWTRVFFSIKHLFGSL